MIDERMKAHLNFTPRIDEIQMFMYRRQDKSMTAVVQPVELKLITQPHGTQIQPFLKFPADGDDAHEFFDAIIQSALDFFPDLENKYIPKHLEVKVQLLESENEYLKKIIDRYLPPVPIIKIEH